MAELAPDARRYEMGQGSHVRNGRPGGSAPTLPELTWGERAASHRTSSSDKRGRASPKHDPLGLKQRLKAATRSLPLAGYPILTKPAQLPSSTPCGGGPTRPKAERGGGAGHRAPGRSRPALHQPQGQGPRDPSGPAPAAERTESRVGDGAPCPATPFSLGLRPSRSSPQGGGGMRRRARRLDRSGPSGSRASLGRSRTLDTAPSGIRAGSHPCPLPLSGEAFRDHTVGMT